MPMTITASPLAGYRSRLGFSDSFFRLSELHLEVGIASGIPYSATLKDIGFNNPIRWTAFFQHREGGWKQLVLHGIASATTGRAALRVVARAVVVCRRPVLADGIGGILIGVDVTVATKDTRGEIAQQGVGRIPSICP